MEWPRVGLGTRPAAERIADYREIYREHTPEQARRQAGRCMDCGVPFCQQGCPLGNPIPDFNELVYRNRYEQAYRVLASTNEFPELTGRLCPAPCEAACTLAFNREAVTIEQMEERIAERAFQEGWVQPRPVLERSGKRVAVVGSGPAGLAAAALLNRAGHEVTVFERADRVGGLLRYGIPDFKLEKWVLDRRLEVLRAEGVRLETGVDVGGSVGWDELRGRHDALLIAIGARVPRDLDVPGRDLRGVVWAMDMLEQQNRLVAQGGEGEASSDGISARDKRVVVLGGGDTGSDCVGTAHRQGARSIRQIELLPMPPSQRPQTNPWPQWPLVLRTSSSHDEGGERAFGLRTTRLQGEGGVLRRLCAEEVTLQAGRLVASGAGERMIDVDLLVLAMGFLGPDTSSVVQQLGVELDARGNLSTPGGYATNVDGVFAAGDARRGQSLVVWAIAEGREAARELDGFLRGEPSPLPTRGRDFPFGGR